MNIDKIKLNNLNIQNQLKTEVAKPQSENLPCENSIETSIYNQKGLTLPFCGFWNHTHKFQEECIDLLNSARNGKYKKFNKADIEQILKILEKEQHIKFKVSRRVNKMLIT